MQTGPQETVTPPPPAPEIARRIRMRPINWIGMSIIAAFPICAALGVFGSSAGTRSASGASIELTVDYPTRCRYEVIELLEVRVRNRSSRTIERATVVFDPAYLKGFSQAQFTPSPQRAFEIELTQIEPGETGLISAEIQGENYGRYRGEIAVKAADESVAVNVSTLIFP